MVDFAKLKAEAHARMEANKNKPIPPSERARLQHLLNFHLQEMTEWEANFCYSNVTWLTNHTGRYMSDKSAAKLAEIEAQYCGQICHELNRNGIGHN